MRVVMLSKALVVGAYQRKAEELAKLPGVELTVLVPPSWREPGNLKLLERAFTSGYDLRVLPILMNGRFHTHVYPTLGRELRRARPDIVHADEEPYNLATFHAFWEAGHVGARRVFFTWQNLHRRLPPPFSLIERWVLGHTDAAIAGSADAVGVLRRKGYRGAAEVIWQFGVDPLLFHPVARHVRQARRPFTIGYVGRYVRPKGVLDLVDACGALPGDWRLRFVGEGPLESALRDRATQLGIGGRTEILPPVASTAVPDVMRELDVLALPSHTTPSWREQFGRVLVEAMACGAVPVGSDSGEIPHVVADAGLIVPEGDVAALSDALGRLMTDDELCADLRDRGRQRVLGRYTQAQVARATHDVYRVALSVGGAVGSDRAPI